MAEILSAETISALSVDSQQCVTKLEKESGMKNILTVIKSLLDKEAIFVKEELRRTYKPKTEARVRLAGSADEKRLHILFDILSRAPKQLALLMKYVECSGIAGFAGDVVISAIKRDKGIKDMGDSIPGHGGVFDRIDSLSYTAPVFFHLVYYIAY